jgi:hypothetical protein
MLLVLQTRQRTDVISSCTGPNSTIFEPIFHKRLFIEINLERKKQLVYFPSKNDLMKNSRTGFCGAQYG